MGAGDTTVEVEFPYAREDVFNAICASLRNLGPSFFDSRSGMELESADELSGHILIKAGASLFSWGETITASLTEVSAAKTRVVFTSSPKIGFLGAEADFGKNRRNIEDLIRETSKALKNSKPQRATPSALPPPPPQNQAESSKLKIFLLREGQQCGPYLLEDLQDWLGKGRISPDDLIWYDGLQAWTPLRQFIS